MARKKAVSNRKSRHVLWGSSAKKAILVLVIALLVGGGVLAYGNSNDDVQAPPVKTPALSADEPAAPTPSAEQAPPQPAPSQKTKTNTQPSTPSSEPAPGYTPPPVTYDQAVAIRCGQYLDPELYKKCYEDAGY